MPRTSSTGGGGQRQPAAIVAQRRDKPRRRRVQMRKVVERQRQMPGPFMRDGRVADLGIHAPHPVLQRPREVGRVVRPHRPAPAEDQPAVILLAEVEGELAGLGHAGAGGQGNELEIGDGH